MARHAADILGQRVKNDLVLRAMRGKRTERTPVWLMRQAGRFDPAYRQLRQDAGLELEALFAHPTYAARITTLPVRFGVDAAILFQDILTPLGPMGAPFIFRPGPVLDHPVRTSEDANRLHGYDPHEQLAFVAESIHLALDRLGGELPLLGFAGAPLTLLCFLIEGGSPGSDAARIQQFLGDHVQAAKQLLERLADVTAAYLRMQIDAGVHAVQLFESCAAMLDPTEYRRYALPYQQRIFAALSDDVPRVLFVKDIDPVMMAQSGADVISVGSGVCLADAKRAMKGKAVQGNVNNDLLLRGTPEQVYDAACACIRQGGQEGHILNLGHGVHKDTPVENVQAMIDAARQPAEAAA